MARTQAKPGRGPKGARGSAPGSGGQRSRSAPQEPAATETFPQRWRTVSALGLSVAGLGVATYLTIAHFADVPLVCNTSGIVNCERVTTSAESYFLGVPVAFWGLLFFVAMTAINLPVAWRAADRRVHALRLAMTVGGMCFVLYLVSAELLIIKNICLWCTSVHVITFLLFVLTMATVPQMLGWGTSGYRTT